MLNICGDAIFKRKMENLEKKTEDYYIYEGGIDKIEIPEKEENYEVETYIYCGGIQEYHFIGDSIVY